MAEENSNSNNDDSNESVISRDHVIIYNPKHGSEINDIHSKKTWNHKVNQLKAYPRKFGEYLLEKYGFLVLVLPENLKAIKKTMKEKPFKCEHCDYETDTEKGLLTHKRLKHKIDEETAKMLGDIELVDDSSGEEFESYREKVSKNDPERMEGIPNTKAGSVKDRDNVEWYGEGFANDQVSSGMMALRIPGTKGTFR